MKPLITVLFFIFITGCQSAQKPDQALSPPPKENKKTRKQAIVNIIDRWEYESGEKKVDPNFKEPIIPGIAICKLGDNSCSADYQPRIFISPSFPKLSIDFKIKGECVVETTINTQGKPINPKILSCTPAGLFDQQTIASAKRAKFHPRVVKGEYTEVTGAQIKYQYSVKPAPSKRAVIDKGIHEYSQRTGHKSLAIAYDRYNKYPYVYAFADEFINQDFANIEALKKCEKAREKHKVKAECLIYAEGDNFLFD